MKKIKNKFILILIFNPIFALADCPIEIEVSKITYCLDFNWVLGERKIRGEFSSTNKMSPYFISMGEPPQKWIYSKAVVSIWEKNDDSQALVELNNFKIFPYMHMEKGHHHLGSYNFYYDTMTGKYILRHMALTKMPGYWSLRYTKEIKENLETSSLLFKLNQ